MVFHWLFYGTLSLKPKKEFFNCKKIFSMKFWEFGTTIRFDIPISVNSKVWVFSNTAHTNKHEHSCHSITQKAIASIHCSQQWMNRTMDTRKIMNFHTNSQSLWPWWKNGMATNERFPMFSITLFKVNYFRILWCAQNQLHSTKVVIVHSYTHLLERYSKQRQNGLPFYSMTGKIKIDNLEIKGILLYLEEKYGCVGSECTETSNLFLVLINSHNTDTQTHAYDMLLCRVCLILMSLGSNQ